MRARPPMHRYDAAGAANENAAPKGGVVHGCMKRRSKKRALHERSAFGRPGSDLLSRVLRRTIIGAEEFNGRVRNGIGFRPLAIATKPAECRSNRRLSPSWSFRLSRRRRASRMRVIKPNELLVPVSFMRCRTSTPGLSTWWSSTALQGEIVSRWVSRLDAFSGYPVRT
jgi:hypothetical protein